MTVVVTRCSMFSERRITRRILERNAVKSIKNRHNGINVTIRRTLGQDIDASCGQLRKKYTENLKSQ